MRSDEFSVAGVWGPAGPLERQGKGLVPGTFQLLPRSVDWSYFPEAEGFFRCLLDSSSLAHLPPGTFSSWESLLHAPVPGAPVTVTSCCRTEHPKFAARDNRQLGGLGSRPAQLCGPGSGSLLPRRPPGPRSFEALVGLEDLRAGEAVLAVGGRPRFQASLASPQGCLSGLTTRWPASARAGDLRDSEAGQPDPIAPQRQEVGVPGGHPEAWPAHVLKDDSGLHREAAWGLNHSRRH